MERLLVLVKRLGWTTAFAGLGLLRSRDCHSAETLPTTYSPPGEFAESFVAFPALLVIVAAAALIVYTLVTRRGRLLELLGGVALISAVVILRDYRDRLRELEIPGKGDPSP